jgi:uncharacterized membrane protein YdcZ (DUF606 family)
MGLTGLGGAIGFMISHQPNSNAWLLRWQPEKLVWSLVGALIGTVLLTTIRWWIWRDRTSGAANPARGGTGAEV